MTRGAGLVTMEEIKSLDGTQRLWHICVLFALLVPRLLLPFSLLSLLLAVSWFLLPHFSWVLRFVANVALGSLVSASLASAPLLWVPVAFLLTVPWSSISHASFASSHVSGSEAGARMQMSHPKFNSRASFPAPPKHCVREKGYIVCHIPANMGI